MAKDAYYFSHDMNARSDIKIMSMRSVYGSEGYGWFWIIIELMRAEEDYKIRINQKYSFHALAREMETTPEAASTFIDDCVKEFELFQTDGESIWSNSLIGRLENMETLKQKRVQAGKKGGLAKSEKQESSKSVANDKQTSSKSVANPSTKLNYTTLNDTTQNNTDDAVAFYQSNIGIISPIILQEIDEWSTALDNDSVKLAISIAAGNNSRKWSYVKAILSDWYEKGARRLEDCQAFQLDHKRKQQKKNYKPTSAKPKIEVATSTTTVSDDEYQELLKKHGLG